MESNKFLKYEGQQSPWCLWCLFRPEIRPKRPKTFETSKIVEFVEIANIHAVFTQVTENMVGRQKRLGEYPNQSHAGQCVSVSSPWSDQLNPRPWMALRSATREELFPRTPFLDSFPIADIRPELIPKSPFRVLGAERATFG